MNTKQINGQTCRYYYAGNIYVSKDGLTAADASGNILSIVKSKGGSYVTVRRQKIYIAQAVITCYCKPKPKDGKVYVIKHTDGNINNCNSANMSWQLKHYVTSTADHEEVKILGLSYNVYNDGRIFDNNGKEMQQDDYMYDSDTDCFCCIDPFISVPSSNKRFFIDKIMAVAGFINGDDAVLQSPVVLHRDNDWKNFNSNNLEWVESSDVLYRQFQDVALQEKKKRNVQLNPGKRLPPGWA